MTTLVPLPGDPDSLASKASRYGRVADAIRETAAQLKEFASRIESEGGKSVAVLRERAGDAGLRVEKVHPRYETTANALATYAVNLRDAQNAANAAINAADSADTNLPYWRNQVDDLRPPVRTVVTAEQLEDYYQALARVEEIEQNVANAVADYERAVRYRDDAAGIAIAAITPVLERMNDTLGDWVDRWAGAFPGFLQGIAQWIGDIFVSVVETLQNAIDRFVLMVTYIVTVIALIPEIIANYPPEMWVLALLVPATIPTMLALALLLSARIAKEGMRPTPDMVEITAPGGMAGSSSGTPYADTMTTNKILDSEGNTESTIVEITEVLDADGNRVGWRVVLPSTQDWQEAGPGFGDPLAGDQSAMNDLDSNLALMLTPSQQAAYERAVIQAMFEAGIGPNDPVMLSGWSQGGILAGKMASDPNSPFNIQALYVSGAPIDAMSIPSHISVISVQHTGEPVAILDGPFLSPGVQAPNWVTVTQNPPAGFDPHNPDAYIATANQYVDNSTDPHVIAIKDDQAMFFSENEIVHQYQGAEQPVPLLGVG